jgi:flagellar basal-body rod modification protein FlgD
VTTPISGTSGTAGTGQTTTTTGQSKTSMDKDLFLKLLVAQLKYQDPSKPADATAFLAQTAQFTMVEKLEDSSKAQQSLLNAQLMLGATNLVGRTVSYTGADGIEHTGVVSSATISGSSPTVKVGNTDVPLSSVKEVRNPSTNS